MSVEFITGPSKGMTHEDRARMAAWELCADGFDIGDLAILEIGQDWQDRSDYLALSVEVTKVAAKWEAAYPDVIKALDKAVRVIVKDVGACAWYTPWSEGDVRLI